MALNILDREKKFLEELISQRNQNGLDWFGKLFNTEMNNYFYDNGTGKVITFDDEIYNIFSTLFNYDGELSYEDFINCKYNFSERALKEFLQTVFDENLLQAPRIDKLYSYAHHEGLEDRLNNMEILILELTGKCNLRCGYCIYNDKYKLNRSFNDREMSKDVAKLAIDYANAHSKDKLAVTFYGGEPLVKFDLLKWCIEYALQTVKNKELSFSLTTNLTLVTDEIAQYLASVPNLSVVCSFDGPEYVHNSYRKFASGEGSFKKAIAGLEKLAKNFSKTNHMLSINAVYAPPYSYSKLDDIKDFFKNLTWLPENTEIRMTYPTKGSVVDERKEFERMSTNPKYWTNTERTLDPLWIWGKKQVMLADKLEHKKSTLIDDQISTLLRIHKRFISDEPVNIYPLNSCCVPGSRRLYVDTKGDFYTCERIGSSPSIGNVYDGIDYDNIKKFFVKEYEENTKDCTNCWALRICDACYVNAYTKSGFNKQERDSMCKGFKASAEQQLVLYHSIYEIDPEKLNVLNDWVIS